jgi:phenylpropionate dioxygenase-like ring-hydroxylating dioxygenase large terminal subunit
MKNFKLPGWAAALKDPEAFKREQDRLGHVWTLLGLTTQVPNDGDWFRATLGGRSVFVQRFGDELRGFENVCVHRFYPLRTKDKGNGVIRCGFHHWLYNKDGLAVGIPKCKELFGVTPRELGATLRKIDVATCGNLIFGRFRSDEAKEPLEDYLGVGFPILRAMTSVDKAPYHLSTEIAANWKLCFHISLDDYHLVAVHSDTFGKHGYLDADVVRYYRFGSHSAYFYGEDADALARMNTECAAGKYIPHDYRIMQFFPNLVVVHTEAAKNFYIVIQQYVPVAWDKTLLRTWYFPSPLPYPANKGWWHDLQRRVAAPFLPFFVKLYTRKITGEDNAVVERIQSNANYINGWPMLGAQEERITWFEETYNKALGAPPLAVEVEYPVAVPTVVNQTP